MKENSKQSTKTNPRYLSRPDVAEIVESSTTPEDKIERRAEKASQETAKAPKR
jgi:hypothetical protein